MNPAYPDTSARSCTSLLTIASSAKSTLPVLAPELLLPVGSFSIGRIASDTFLRSNWLAKLIFAPSQKSPILLPLHDDAVSGLVGTTPPTLLKPDDDRNSGRMSRSIRLTTTNDPNTSARFRRP